MKWTWKIGRFAGIDVFVHTTFLIFIAWMAFVHWQEHKSIAAVVEGVGWMLALFGCVVLHEFGHALTARRFGIKTRDITLLPIGGVARLERIPEDPYQEMLVALAGPGVNVAIAALLWLWIWIVGSWQPVETMGITKGSFLGRLLIANIILVVFNLLPAFPMDGGRVLRALLATRLDHARATGVAGVVGQAMALLLAFIGFLSNPLFIFIALFVWIGASQEMAAAQMKSAFGGIPVSRAMLTDFRTVSPRDVLSQVVELILAGSQQDFPVVEDGRVVGVLTRADVLSAMAKFGPQVRVEEAMQREFPVVDSGELLDAAFQRIQGSQGRTVPVMRGGQLVGLLTMENLGEFLMIQSALEASKRPHGGWR